MKILIAQFNPIIGDFVGIAAKMRSLLRYARQEQPEALVVFPELALTGYAPRDLLLKKDFIGKTVEQVNTLAQEFPGLHILTGAPWPNSDTGKPLHNVALLLHGGQVQLVIRKHYLPTYDVFDEARYFEPAVGEVSMFTLGDEKIGVTICEDLWNEPEFFSPPLYHDQLLERFQREKIKLMINIAASPYHRGKVSFRYRLLSHIARKYSWNLLYVNQAGAQDSLIFDGGSAFWHSDGSLGARASFFREEAGMFDWNGPDQLVYHEVTNWSGGTPQPSHLDLSQFSCLRSTQAKDQDFQSPLSLNRMTLAALLTGIGDYFAKTSSRRALLGLSGGIDSALVAFLAIQALGAKNVHVLLMPSPFSSEGSVTDSLDFCKRNQLSYDILPIDDLYFTYLDSLSRIIQPDEIELTHENIQARIRGNLLMAYANKQKAIVLATSNKSESAMGYATLYGDMAGGLSPILDMSKTLVYEISNFINEQFAGEPIPRNIIQKAPSAELRPGQKDSDSLPDYPILDYIIEGYIEKHLAPQTIIAGVGEKFFLPRQECSDLVQSVVRKIHLAEYKRKQATIGLKISERDFTVGRRFPIVHKYIEI